MSIEVIEKLAEEHSLNRVEGPDDSTSKDFYTASM